MSISRGFKAVGRFLGKRPVEETTGLTLQDHRVVPQATQVQGAPRGLSMAADFLTAFGAGVPAAQQQQQMRRQTLLQQLGQVAQQGQQRVQAQKLQQEMDAANLDMAIKRAPKSTYLESLNVRIESDPVTGKVTIWELKDAEGIRKNIEHAISKIESVPIRGIALAGANAAFAAGKIQEAFDILDSAQARDSAERGRLQVSPTTDIINYNYAKQQGYRGTFEQWQRDEANRRTPRISLAATPPIGLTEAVIANPELFSQLSPTVKTSIIPELNRRGFGNFGRPLSDTAVKEITQSQSAIDSLKDLRQIVIDYEPYIGPISGLQALNPWSKATEARAKFDAVRQRVGKALEGGVLRKEDEEKYKRILAEITNIPSTATFKIDEMAKDIERDMQTYVQTQSLAGRRALTPAGAPVTMRAPDGTLGTVISKDVERLQKKGYTVVK